MVAVVVLAVVWIDALPIRSDQALLPPYIGGVEASSGFDVADVVGMRLIREGVVGVVLGARGITVLAVAGGRLQAMTCVTSAAVTIYWVLEGDC